MLTSATGSSILADAKEAGLQAAKQLQGLDQPKVIFAYASVDYDLSAMVEGITQAMPGVPVVGNTSFTGVITPQGYITSDHGFVGLLGLGGDELTVGTIGVEKTGDSREIGAVAARAAMLAAGQTTAPDFFYMSAPPAEEEFFLKGVSDVIGRIPFFGGSAADNSIAGLWRLYTDKGVFADGITLAFFYTKKPIVNLYTGAFRETGDMGIITKLSGKRTLCEIDGVPAIEKYAAWRGITTEKMYGGDLLVTTITSPLGIKDRLGDLIAIRHPMFGNEDGSMNIGSNMAVGTAVIRMEASVDELIATASETLRSLKKKLPWKAAAYHLVHCGGRRAGIGDRLNEVAAALQQEAGDVPFIVEFTFGEYGHEDDGRNTCGGLMLSYTAFME